MIRAFVAIKPPPDLRQAIETIRHALDTRADNWRWVKPENVHLTLKFFGNVATDAVAPITQAMQRAVEGQEAFRLTLRTLGCFPSATRPRVLWMGLDDPRRTLVSLYQRLEDALEKQGFSPEKRPFHPHLTLARTKREMAPGTLGDIIRTYQDQQFGTINIEQIVLFQSQLHRDGAVYTILRSVTLSS